MKRRPRIRQLWLAVITLSLMLAACGPATVAERPPALVLSADSGFVTKAQALPFLLAMHITDSADAYWTRRIPHDGDTIGKYYRMNEQGDIMALVRVIDPTDKVETFITMRLNKKGGLMKYMQVPCYDEWCAENSITTFCRIGKYYMVRSCGHGSAFSSEHTYIFHDVDTGCKLNAIFFGNYSYFGIEDPRYAQMIDADMELRGDSIILLYKVQKGDKENEEIKWLLERKVRVAYMRMNGRWTTTDSAQLVGMDME